MDALQSMQPGGALMTKIAHGLLITTKDGETVEFHHPLHMLMARRPITAAVAAFILGLFLAAIRL